MADAKEFDPYHRWLGIPLKDQPANHYRLLGIQLYEDDVEVIESSADRQMKHVRTFQAGQYGRLSQKILNELAAARVTLLTPEKKHNYDQQLRSELSAADRLKVEPSAASQMSTESASLVQTHEIPARSPVQSKAQSQTTLLPPATRQPIMTARAAHSGRNSVPSILIFGLAGSLLVILLAVAAVSVYLAFAKSNTEVAIVEGKSETGEKRSVESKMVNKGKPNIEKKINSAEKSLKTRPKPKTTRGKRKVTPGQSSPKKQLRKKLTRGAVLKVAGMSSHPFERASNLPDKPKSATSFTWSKKPRTNVKNGVLKFDVLESGTIFLVTLTNYQGNSAGGWAKTRVTKDDLAKQGWEIVGKCPWNNKEHLLRKEVRKGEKYSIRTNKYWPPEIIIPNYEIAKSTKLEIVNLKPNANSKPHFLRLGDRGGIELLNTKGIFGRSKKSTIEFVARLHDDIEHRNIVGDRVYGNKYPELNNQQGGFVVCTYRRKDGKNGCYMNFIGGSIWRQYTERNDRWQHFAVANDSKFLRFFVDGKKIQERKTEGSDWNPGPTNLHLGFHRFLFFSGKHGFNGDLKAMRLSETCRYSEEFDVPSSLRQDSDTIAIYNFSNPNASKAKDVLQDTSGNGHHGKIVGSVWMKFE